MLGETTTHCLLADKTAGFAFTAASVSLHFFSLQDRVA